MLTVESDCGMCIWEESMGEEVALPKLSDPNGPGENFIYIIKSGGCLPKNPVVVFSQTPMRIGAPFPTKINEYSGWGAEIEGGIAKEWSCGFCVKWNRLFFVGLGQYIISEGRLDTLHWQLRELGVSSWFAPLRLKHGII